MLLVQLVKKGFLESDSQLFKDLVVAAVVDQIVAEIEREVRVVGFVIGHKL